MRTTLERMKAVLEIGMTTNREAMLEKLADLDTEHAKAVAGGGEKYVDRHHARGKLMPRERIELLDRRGLGVPRASARWPAGAPTSRSAPAWSPASA